MKSTFTLFLSFFYCATGTIFAQSVDSIGIYYRQSEGELNSGKRTEMLHKAAEYGKKIPTANKDTLGLVFCELGKESVRVNKDQSMAFFKAAEALLKNNTNMDIQQKLSEVYDNLGDIHKTYLLLDDAFAYYNKSIAIRLPIAESRKEDAVAQHNLCVIYQLLSNAWTAKGNLSKRLSAAEQALQIAERSPEGSRKYRDLYVSNTMIGIIKMEIGDFGKAETLYKEGLNNAKILAASDTTNEKYQRDIWVILIKIGDLHNVKGSKTQAAEYYEKALEAAKQMIRIDVQKGKPKSTTEESTCYNKLSSLWKGNDNKKANFYADKSLSLLEASVGESTDYNKTQGLRISRHKKADVLVSEKNYVAALVYFKKSVNECLVAVEKDSTNQGKLKSLFLVYSRIGDIYKRKEVLDSALFYFDKSLIFSQKILIQDSISTAPQKNHAACNTEIATIYIQQNKCAAAKLLIVAAIARLEKAFQRESLGANEAEMAHLLVQLKAAYRLYHQCVFTSKTSDADAFTMALRNKSYLLYHNKSIINTLQSMDNTDLVPTYEAYCESLRNGNTLKEEGTSAQFGLKKIRLQTDSLARILNAGCADFSVRNDWWKTTYHDIKKSLRQNEAAIEIVEFDDSHDTTTTRYAAYILTAKSETVQEVLLPTLGKDLNGKCFAQYKNAIYSQKNDLSATFEVFWKPISDALPRGIKKVWLSPEGIYHKINIASLDTLRTIAQVSSTRIAMRKTNSKTVKTKTMMLFGNPSFNKLEATLPPIMAEEIINTTNFLAENEADFKQRGGLNPLPNAEKEVRNIAALANKMGWKCDTFLNAAATEDRLKTVKSPTVLHIATHAGFLDNAAVDAMDNGRLYLAAAQLSAEQKKGRENGILYASEAALLRLYSTELVVLSACKTGEGEVRNSEGVFGLQRAFFIAGAEAVLMSLWRVDDEATQIFMTQFYTEWLVKKQDKRTALARAQAALRRNPQFAAPYFWSAFVLVE
jgi:tetratricopeptide (TPR) repeat protein